MYTLARFAAFLVTCVAAVVIWGLVRHGFSVVRGVAQMMVARWYFWVPISLFWALTDLVRICAKTVVPATYMYVVLSLAVAIDAITQTVVKNISPGMYVNVPNGWIFPVICLLGGLVVAVGSCMWPHEREELTGDDLAD